MKVGVSGYSGFIGWHLRARAHLTRTPLTLVPLGRDVFSDSEKMKSALVNCDAVVHLAGGRFSQDDDEDYSVNLSLTKALTEGLEKSRKVIPLLFASSRSIEKQTGYGRSKRDGMALVKAWGEKTGAPVLSLIMPNVYGEFAQPDHHTVTATFCRDIAEGKPSKVNEDGQMELLHAQDAAERMLAFLVAPVSGEERMVGEKISARGVYDLFTQYYDSYKNNIFPATNTPFEKRLFNMLYSYAFTALVPRQLTPHSDERGALVETIRSLSAGQSFTSTSVPEAIRGEHCHIRKIERFFVIKGEAVIRMRKLMSDEVLEYPVSGDTPVYMDMPTFYSHHIQNVGKSELVASFWTNELFDPADPDTYPEKVR